MAKEPRRPAAEPDEAALAEVPYERLVSELDGVVQKLEAGELTLEDSLKAFERGVRLAQAAEGRLDQAEQRIEVLLQGDKTAPLPADARGGEGEAPRGEPTRAKGKEPSRQRPPGDDEEVPF